MACKRSAVRSRLPPPRRKNNSSDSPGSPSSRGLGHHPFTVSTGVRIPVGTPRIWLMSLSRCGRAAVRATHSFRSPSSRGLGHHPFTVSTGVRIPVGTPVKTGVDQRACAERCSGFSFGASFSRCVHPRHAARTIQFSNASEALLALPRTLAPVRICERMSAASLLRSSAAARRLTSRTSAILPVQARRGSPPCRTGFAGLSPLAPRNRRGSARRCRAPSSLAAS